MQRVSFHVVFIFIFKKKNDQLETDSIQDAIPPSQGLQCLVYRNKRKVSPLLEDIKGIPDKPRHFKQCQASGSESFRQDIANTGDHFSPLISDY